MGKTRIVAILRHGQRVTHEIHGSGTVCMVEFRIEKCYQVQFDCGEKHSYSARQARIKLRPVPGDQSASVEIANLFSELPPWYETQDQHEVEKWV
jgi:hypothetical protein